MLQILRDTKIPFMKYRRIMYMITGAFVLATAVWLIVNRGPRYSVDFTGGTLIQVQTARVLPPDDVRKALDQAGFSGYEVQQAGQGEELMIRLPVQTDPTVSTYERVKTALVSQFPDSNPELRREETVGPKIGAELRDKAFWAVMFSLGGILLYVGIRYEFKFAVGAVVALFNSVFTSFGILCFLNREISLTVIAALLTLAGYSINDTIVVFDRIRERSKQLHKLSHEDMMNTAINETLSRTIVTSITVVLATLSLYLFGGDALNDFALCILVGIVFGTFSSIFVASALALDIWNWLDRKKGITRAKAA